MTFMAFCAKLKKKNVETTAEKLSQAQDPCQCEETIPHPGWCWRASVIIQGIWVCFYFLPHLLKKMFRRCQSCCSRNHLLRPISIPGYITSPCVEKTSQSGQGHLI